MGLTTLRNVRFAGMTSCVPKLVISNLTDCPPAIRSERERIVRNIGIETRRMAPTWQCFSDLAFIAAETLLEKLNWRREDIDALVVITQSPDYLMPATAIILQDRLRLPTSAIAFDVNLGCSAYPFGIHLVGSMISGGGVKKALILVGDRSATLYNPLFSDAGTATALEFCEKASPMYFDLNSDGAGFRAIIAPVGGQRQPFGIQHTIPYRHHDDDRWHSPTELILDGAAVLSFSTNYVPPAVEKLLGYAGLTKEEVDYFIFHQANRMINETIRKKLALPAEKVPSTLKDFGNSSGASLPVTMTVRIREALQVGKNTLLLSGFGIGLSWGTALVVTENPIFPELIEA